MNGIGKNEFTADGGWPWFENGRPGGGILGGRKPKTVLLRRAMRIGDIRSTQCRCNCAMAMLNVRSTGGGLLVVEDDASELLSIAPINVVHNAQARSFNRNLNTRSESRAGSIDCLSWHEEICS